MAGGTSAGGHARDVGAGASPFTRNSLRQLLTNVAYRGQLRYKQEVHPGEHAAIVDPCLWQQVQAGALLRTAA